MQKELEAQELRLEALMQALPYIKEFNDTVIVIKYGGSQLRVGLELDSFADDIVLLRSLGIKVVVVHGGGPQVDDAMKVYGKEPEFIEGLRVTDYETLTIARMVLVGKVGRDIVAAINRHGGYGVGTTGEDGRLMIAKKKNPKLGFVGTVTEVRTSILERLFSEQLIPVISTIGVTEDGESLNINADEAAAAIAIALKAKKLIIMSNIPGIMKDITDPDSVINNMTVEEATKLTKSDTISAGMIPKIKACIDAVAGGAERSHIIDGRQNHSVLLELFTETGVGTMITP